MTKKQLDILQAIHAAGGPISWCPLVKASGLTSSYVGVTLLRLTRAGLVVRHPETDEKKVTYSLTKAGKEAAKEKAANATGLPLVLTAAQKAALRKGLSDEDRAIFDQRVIVAKPKTILQLAAELQVSPSHVSRFCTRMVNVTKDTAP